MADLFASCDDIHDAAADGIRAINQRLSRRGLQLEPLACEALREVLRGALQLAEVEIRPDCLAVEEALARGWRDG